MIFRKPDKGEAGIQLNILNEMKAKGVKGIAVSVINPEEQTPELKRIAKEINLITMDNDAKDSDRLCYIGTDNYEAGKAVGRLVKEVMPKGGKEMDLAVKGNASADVDCKMGCTLSLGGKTEAIDGKMAKIAIKAGKFVM